MITKTQKPPELIGDKHPITAWQIKAIMRNCSYQVDTKNEWVQWATGDENRTSLKSINQAHAKKIILQQTGGEIITQPKEKFFATFDIKKPSHRKILSLMRTAQWTKPSDKHGEIPDMEILDKFIKSDKSPVIKPLMQMSDQETQKLIQALNGIIKSKYK
jgi:hypothetical protein